MPDAPLSAKDTPLRLTRRAVFAGTASLAATTLAPAAPPPTRDAELTALGAEFEQALAVQAAAQRHFNDCERRYLSRCPDVPRELTSDGSLGHRLAQKWDYWTARELRALLRDPERREEWPTAHAVLAVARANEAAERRLRRKLGLAAAERAAEAASDRVDALTASILAASAGSRAGYVVKAQVVKASRPEWWSEEASHADMHERLAAQIVDSVLVPPP